LTATFCAPTSLVDALEAMAGGGVPLAGGTDLVVGHRQGKKPLPDALVSIERIAELHGIDAGSAGVIIGALTTHAVIHADETVRRRYTALADASAIVGSVATRGTGTLGGNVMNASPAADTIAALLCHDGVAVLASIGGTRRVALRDLFVAPGRTIASPSELLVSIELAPHATIAGSAYVRLEYRRHMEIAVVGAAASVELDAAGTLTKARVAMTALAPTVRLVPGAEQALLGTTGDSGDVEAASRAVAQNASPISDVRASATYRRAMAEVVTRRAIEAALARAKGGDVAIPASDSTFGAEAARVAGPGSRS
jgi:CO/xanthine dehydrogenase FAD-binding subunit